MCDWTGKVSDPLQRLPLLGGWETERCGWLMTGSAPMKEERENHQKPCKVGWEKKGNFAQRPLTSDHHRQKKKHARRGET